MKKYILVLSIFLGTLLSCGTTEMVIPEGTPTEVAEVMKKYYLQKPKAEKLINAFENQSGLANFKLNDISSVRETTMGTNRVLVVSVGSNDVIVNLD
jgi:hypothetical protein